MFKVWVSNCWDSSIAWSWLLALFKSTINTKAKWDLVLVGFLKVGSSVILVLTKCLGVESNGTWHSET